MRLKRDRGPIPLLPPIGFQLVLRVRSACRCPPVFNPRGFWVATKDARGMVKRSIITRVPQWCRSVFGICQLVRRPVVVTFGSLLSAVMWPATRAGYCDWVLGPCDCVGPYKVNAKSKIGYAKATRIPKLGINLPRSQPSTKAIIWTSTTKAQNNIFSRAFFTSIRGGLSPPPLQPRN